MSTNSRIEWTEATWNPVTGCTKISPGCRFCYAEVMAKRLLAMRQPRYKNGFKVTLQDDLLELPLKWKRPKVIFVNSMSDLFHQDVPASYIRQVFETMQRAEQHTFQVLTKRSERLRELAPALPWPGNVWIGVSVEDQRRMNRIADLCAVRQAAVRFLSCEPLLEALPSIPLLGMDWVIVGGESGRKPRPMQAEWVRDIRDQCQRAGVPFFFKQWGGTNKKKAGRLLDERTWDEMPPPVQRSTKQLPLGRVG
ncbi:MAG: phage Gp37/Gp68 family protein [Myxococcota bacterium]